MSTPLYLLAIETSGAACSVALLHESGIDEMYDIAERNHTQRILKMIDDLLVKNSCSIEQINVIAYGCGPGSFTGTRIASSVAQGIAFARKIPVLAVSGLQALAQDAFDTHKEIHTVFSAIDARMNETYWASYHRDKFGYAEPNSIENMSTPAQWITPEATSEIIGIGTAFSAFADQLPLDTQSWHIQKDAHPRARAIARLAEHMYAQKSFGTSNMLPTYLREAVL